MRGHRAVKLEDFISEEINKHTRDVILTNIAEGKELNKFKDEIVLNRYSLELFFEENVVIIYDDIFSETEPLRVSLEEFLEVISNTKTED